MSLLCLSPQYFVGYNILLEFLFSIITLGVALFSYKAYKSTGLSQIKNFAAGFFFIFLGYFSQVFTSLLIYLMGHEVVCKRKVLDVLFLNALGFYSYVLFILFGLLILVYMTFKRVKQRVLVLLMLMALVVVFFSSDIFLSFYTLTTIAFTFLSWHFIETYLKNKKKNSLMVVVAFLSLTLASLLFLVSMTFPALYVTAKLLELFGYIFIIVNFYLILKKR
ncbi:MAG: hypothetical protein ACMXX7_00665 [Candidatus Woesearchaeota archaeon]